MTYFYDETYIYIYIVHNKNSDPVLFDTKSNYIRKIPRISI